MSYRNKQWNLPPRLPFLRCALNARRSGSLFTYQTATVRLILSQLFFLTVTYTNLYHVPVYIQMEWILFNISMNWRFTVSNTEQGCKSTCSQMFRCSESVLRILTSSGLMNYMNPQHIFVTVHDAVVYIQQQKVATDWTNTTYQVFASWIHDDDFFTWHISV